MILLVGGNGSIGKRYQAILRSLKAPFCIYDVKHNPTWSDMRSALKISGATKLMIASPTETHVDWCKLAIEKNIPFMCEKPGTKNVEDAKAITNMLASDPVRRGYLVNNWSFVIGRQVKSLSYNFYSTGRDGLLWDVCQLIWSAHVLKADLEIRTDSPIWDVWMDDFHLPYSMIELSYIQMMKAFLAEDDTQLMPFSIAIQQAELILKLERQLEGRIYEGINWFAGPDKIDTITRQDLSKDRREIDSGMGLSGLSRGAPAS